MNRTRGATRFTGAASDTVLGAEAGTTKKGPCRPSQGLRNGIDATSVRDFFRAVIANDFLDLQVAYAEARGQPWPDDIPDYVHPCCSPQETLDEIRDYVWSGRIRRHLALAQLPEMWVMRRFIKAGLPLHGDPGLCQYESDYTNS